MAELDITYGETLYKHDTLKAAVSKYRKVLKKILTAHPEVVGLVSTGSSGSILAGALMLFSEAKKLIHIHVNKDGGGHGHSGVYSGIKFISGSYIFVDDFISSGSSMKRCMDKFKENGHGQKIDHALVNYNNRDCAEELGKIKTWLVE